MFAGENFVPSIIFPQRRCKAELIDGEPLWRLFSCNHRGCNKENLSSLSQLFLSLVKQMAGHKTHTKILYITDREVKRNVKFVHSFLFHEATAPSGSGPPHYRVFTITLKPATLCRTPLDERSARCRDLYLTARNTRNRQRSMSMYISCFFHLGVK